MGKKAMYVVPCFFLCPDHVKCAVDSFFFFSFFLFSFPLAILRSFACSLRYSLTAASAYTREPSIRSSRLRSVHRLLGERRGPQGKDDQSASYWKSVGNLSDICNYPSVWLCTQRISAGWGSLSLSLFFRSSSSYDYYSIYFRSLTTRMETYHTVPYRRLLCICLGHDLRLRSRPRDQRRYRRRLNGVAGNPS